MGRFALALRAGVCLLFGAGLLTSPMPDAPLASGLWSASRLHLLFEEVANFLEEFLVLGKR